MEGRRRPTLHDIQARILEWVAISFSRSSRPRNRTQVSHIAGRRFTIRATREAQRQLENTFILLRNFDSSISEKYFSHGRCVWLVEQAGPQGMTYTLDTVGTMPRAHSTFKASPKCFHFHLSLKKKFIYVWLWWVFFAVRAFPSCGKRRILSSCGAQASHCSGFSCRGA